MKNTIRVLFVAKTEEDIKRLVQPFVKTSCQTVQEHTNIDVFFTGTFKHNNYELLVLDSSRKDLSSSQLSLIRAWTKKVKALLIVSDNYSLDNLCTFNPYRFDYLLVKDIDKLEYISKYILQSIRLDKKLKRSNEIRKKERERLTTTLASIGDGVLATDVKGNITFMNRVAEELTGWAFEDARGKQIDVVFKLIDKDTNQHTESPFLNTIETGTKSGLKRSNALVSQTGEEYFISASSSPIRDSKGKVKGLVAVFRDVTRHRNLEDSLIKSKDYYLTLFERFPALIWRTDTQKKVNYFNENWLGFTGRTYEQEMGDGWKEGIHPGDILKANEIFTHAFDKRSPFEMEYRLKDKAGEYRWILNFGRPFDDLDNEFSGYIGACFDITERKIAEEGLRRYRLLSEKANDIILFADTDGKVIEANVAAVNAFGYTQETILGQSVHCLINLDKDFPKSAPVYHSDSGRVYYETTAYRNDGSTFIAEVSTQTTEMGQNKVLMAILRDATERKRINGELRKAKELAEAANGAKSEFLANMSHEIRTPLNGMIGMIDLTLLTDLTSEQRENLIISKECTFTLLSLVNEILDFSKIEAGKLIIEQINFDIVKLIKHAIKPHIVKANEKGLRFEYEADHRIPQILNGDPHRLKQVINNLLSNAIKFTDSGRIILETKVASSNADEIMIEFKISDTGIGITEEDMHKLFNSFTQVEGSHTRKYGGTGLGLTISKQLIEAMGGSIWLESTKGKGSTFFFAVQLGAAKTVEDKPDDALRTNNTGQPISILLAEDDKVNQMVIAQMLREAGHGITMVNNGREVLEAINTMQVDVVLMDIQMPEMDGIETTRRIREKQAKEGKYVPIIAVTSYALKGDRERFLSLGMDEYISKPIQMDDFLKTIEDVVEKSKSHEYQRNGLMGEKVSSKQEAYSDSFIHEYEKRSEQILQEINENIHQLEYYYEKKDQTQIEKHVHIIKRFSSELAIPLFKNTIFKAELAIRRGDIEGSFEYFQNACKALSNYINEINKKETGEIL